MNSEVQASGIVELVDVGQYVPGIGWLSFKWQKGAPLPRIVVSTTVAAESAVVVVKPIRHSIKLPASIPAKHPVAVSVNARTFIAPAAIARVLAKIDGGADAVELRPETAARFAALVPEIALERDYSRKGHSGNLAWWRVG